MPAANLAFRFVLELAGVAAVAYAAAQVPAAGAVRWVAAAGAATLFIALWGLVIAPKRRNRLSQRQKDVVGTVVLLAAAGALGASGALRLAVGYAVLVLVNAALLLAFGPKARAAFEGGS